MKRAYTHTHTHTHHTRREAEGLRLYISPRYENYLSPRVHEDSKGLSRQSPREVSEKEKSPREVQKRKSKKVPEMASPEAREKVREMHTPPHVLTLTLTDGSCGRMGRMRLHHLE